MEKKINSEKIFDGRVIKVSRDEVALDNGKSSVREVVKHSGGACVLAVKDGKVLLERQYRYAVGAELIEIPAGKRDEGEDLLATAKRELEEETGLIPLNLRKIYEIYPSPGYTNETIGIFFADEFNQSVTHFDEDESLTSFWVEISTAVEWLKTGKITDAKTVIALLWYMNISSSER